jgi:hypothetical protein
VLKIVVPPAICAVGAANSGPRIVEGAFRQRRESSNIASISVMARARGIRSDGSDVQLGVRLHEGDSRTAAGGTAGSRLPYGGKRILRWIFRRIERPKHIQQRLYAPDELEHHASPRIRIISLAPR